MLSYPLWCDGVPELRVQPHPLVIPGEDPVPLGTVLGHVGQVGGGQLRGDDGLVSLCV